MSTRFTAVIGLCCALSAGCFAPLRIGIGPTIDTERQAGVIAFVGAGFGVETRTSATGGGATLRLGGGATTPTWCASSHPSVIASACKRKTPVQSS